MYVGCWRFVALAGIKEFPWETKRSTIYPKVYSRSLGPRKCLCKLFIQLSHTLLMAYFPYGTYS